jgi:hypothetical protein
LVDPVEPRQPAAETMPEGQAEADDEQMPE